MDHFRPMSAIKREKQRHILQLTRQDPAGNIISKSLLADLVKTSKSDHHPDGYPPPHTFYNEAATRPTITHGPHHLDELIQLYAWHTDSPENRSQSTHQHHALNAFTRVRNRTQRDDLLHGELIPSLHRRQHNTHPDSKPSRHLTAIPLHTAPLQHTHLHDNDLSIPILPNQPNSQLSTLPTVADDNDDDDDDDDHSASSHRSLTLIQNLSSNPTNDRHRRQSQFRRQVTLRRIELLREEGRDEEADALEKRNEAVVDLEDQYIS